MMAAYSSSLNSIAPLLLRNLVTSLFFHTDKSLIYLSQKYSILQFTRNFLSSLFLFILRFLPSFFPESPNHPPKHHTTTFSAANFGGAAGGSSVSRSLSHLFQIMNDIPVSSRKYDVVRSLAEKFIDENFLQGGEVLKEVNCTVLSSAFGRSLGQLEAAMADQGRSSWGEEVEEGKRGLYFYGRARGFVKGVTRYGRVAWGYGRGKVEGVSAEKLAAEILWVAEKMAKSGCVDEAVSRWAEATNLAWLSLAAEPRLQGNLVKVTAFLIKQAKKMGHEEGQNITQTKLKLLMSWLPLLCRANNGTDAPVLNIGERAELEGILEEMISALNEEDEQERVLSLWLHHFTYCPASDWPNLRSCYTSWFNASRKRLLLAAASVN